MELSPLVRRVDNLSYGVRDCPPSSSLLHRTEPITPVHRRDPFDISGLTGTSAVTVGRGAVRMPPTSELSGIASPAGYTASNRDGVLLSTEVSVPLMYDISAHLSSDQTLTSREGGGSNEDILQSLPKLMSQTRLVNTRLAQIRNELESVVEAIWRPTSPSAVSSRSPSHRNTSTHLTMTERRSSSKRDGDGVVDSSRLSDLIIAPVPLTSATSLVSLHDALGVVEKQIVAVQHTRRVVTRAMERPLADLKAAHLVSAPNSASSAAALTTGAALRNRIRIAIEFGELEIDLLLREIQQMQDTLMAVERRLLLALGVEPVRGGNDNDTTAMHQDGSMPQKEPMLKYSECVFRRRESVDAAHVRQEVEANMRRDSRFALLLRTRPNTSYHAAGAAAKCLVEDCGWSPRKLQHRSHYDYEMNLLQEQIDREKEKQAQIRNPEAAETNAAALLDVLPTTPKEVCADLPLRGEDLPQSAEEGTDVATATEEERPSCADGKGNESLGGSLTELADALKRLSPMQTNSDACRSQGEAAEGGADEATPLPSPKTPPPEGGRMEESSEAAAPDISVANGQCAATSRDEHVHMSEDGASPHLTTSPRPPSPIHFQDRLREYTRCFLRSGACQWIACQDDTTHSTFYFNLDTGERLDSLEHYFADTVAEMIVRELLSENERGGEDAATHDGWVFVPAGTSGYGDAEYYCHQRSGEVTWSLLDYVKEH